MANLESARGQQFSEWKKKSEHIQRQLTIIEAEWQQISFLQHSSKDELVQNRSQLEVNILSLGWLKANFNQLSKMQPPFPETWSHV